MPENDDDDNVTVEVEIQYFSCPQCWTDDLHCMSCGDEAEVCNCDDPAPLFHCFKCDKNFHFTDCVTYQADPMDFSDTGETGESKSWNSDDESYFDYWMGIQGFDDKKGGESKTKTEYVKKCRHYGERVTFPNGVSVLGSSDRTHGQLGDITPDWGLYAYSGWRPACRSEFIVWADYGIPTHPEIAADAIMAHYNNVVENGVTLEVGCMGGHGRTGTMLACLAVLAGVPHEEAVKWVQDNYCKEAVEGDKQEWWVKWFHAYANGLELPTDMPVSKAKASEVIAIPRKEGEHLPEYDKSNDEVYCGECFTIKWPCPDSKLPIPTPGIMVGSWTFKTSWQWLEKASPTLADIEKLVTVK